MIYHAELLRPREPWRSFSIWCGDFRIEYTAGVENGTVLLCRAIKAAGLSDGAIDVTEVGVQPQHALRHDYDSVYRVATLPVRQTTDALYTMLTQVETDWAGIGEQAALIAADLVTLDGAIARLTETGRQAVVSYQQAHPVRQALVEQRVWSADDAITGGYYAALVAVSEGRHDDLAVTSRRPILLQRQLITADGALTTLGTQKMLDYERRQTVAKSAVTPQMREAFRIIAKMAFRWSDVNTRTRLAMIRAGWVVVTDGLPKLTDAGQTIYVACQAEQPTSAAA